MRIKFVFIMLLLATPAGAQENVTQSQGDYWQKQEAEERFFDEEERRQQDDDRQERAVHQNPVPIDNPLPDIFTKQPHQWKN